MASYQDIESRLAVVEDKIDFVMQSIRMKKQTPSILGGDYLIEETDLLHVYRELKSRDLILPVEEPSNE